MIVEEDEPLDPKPAVMGEEMREKPLLVVDQAE
jgi:hypothetical protein